MNTGNQHRQQASNTVNLNHLPGCAGKSAETLLSELNKGGRFVTFEYTISIIVFSFKSSSDLHYIPPGKKAWPAGLGYTLLTLLLGWWGLPWGPIYTIMALATNLGGGKNMTKKIRSELRRLHRTEQARGPLSEMEGQDPQTFSGLGAQINENEDEIIGQHDAFPPSSGGDDLSDLATASEQAARR